MPDFSEEGVDHYLLNQVDLRCWTVGRCFEKVLKMVRDLTAEVSKIDGHFQSIAHAGVNNENIKDQPAVVSKWAAILRGRCSFNPAIQVLTPSLVLVSVPWRYYSLTGSLLPTPVHEPEKLHQWLELESFTSPAQDWQGGCDTKVCMERDIVLAKVVSLFREHLETAIQTCSFSSKVSILESVGSLFWFNLMATSNYHGLLTFSRAEQALLGGLDEDGGCRRKCYHVVRQLKEDSWCPGTKPVITAFHLQVSNHNTALCCSGAVRSFHVGDWRCIKECVLRVARKLLKRVSQRYLKLLQPAVQYHY
ncbi:unnamed protein product [Coregonus sp. 'balchen']|nr:unnamed protein product [Coregonus sp. 'balchen']